MKNIDDKVDEKKLEGIYEGIYHTGMKPIKEWDQSDYRSGDENLPGSPWYEEPPYDEWDETAMEEFAKHLDEMEHIKVLDRRDTDDGYTFIVKDLDTGLQPEEEARFISAKVDDYDLDPEDGHSATITYKYVNATGEVLDTDTFTCRV